MEEIGKLVVSLDLELYWGLRPQRAIEDCREEILEARNAIPRLLSLFSDYDVRATWAAVGFLFCRSKDEILESLPRQLPAYHDVGLSPYAHIARIGESEADDLCHYGSSLIEEIGAAPGQEIASHTFSNLYCYEAGQDGHDFEADLRVAMEVARRRGIILRSLVFPNNQVRNDYLGICRRLGISAYRGNPPIWPYRTQPNMKDGRVQQWMRTLDSVIPVTGTRCVGDETDAGQYPVNVAATRYLTPLAGRHSLLAAMQRQRIFTELDSAARGSRIFHLWCNVRDFCGNVDKRIDEMAKILERFDGWRRLERMESLTMHEVVMGRSWQDGDNATGVSSRSAFHSL